MPNSTHLNSRHALRYAMALTNELGAHPSAILPAEDADATHILAYLSSAGWHLVHSDDLPAGFNPGDVLRHNHSRIA